MDVHSGIVVDDLLTSNPALFLTKNGGPITFHLVVGEVEEHLVKTAKKTVKAFGGRYVKRYHEMTPYTVLLVTDLGFRANTFNRPAVCLTYIGDCVHTNHLRDINEYVHPWDNAERWKRIDLFDFIYSQERSFQCLPRSHSSYQYIPVSRSSKSDERESSRLKRNRVKLLPDNPVTSSLPPHRPASPSSYCSDVISSDNTPKACEKPRETSDRRLRDRKEVQGNKKRTKRPEKDKSVASSASSVSDIESVAVLALSNDECWPSHQNKPKACEMPRETIDRRRLRDRKEVQGNKKRTKTPETDKSVVGSATLASDIESVADLALSDDECWPSHQNKPKSCEKPRETSRLRDRKGLQGNKNPTKTPETDNSVVGSATSVSDIESVAVLALSDDECWPSHQEESVLKKRGRGYQDRFRHSEKVAMLKWLIEHRKFRNLRGVLVWREMERKRVVPGRSYQSLKNQFLKTLVKTLDDFKFLTEAEKKKFRGEHPEVASDEDDEVFYHGTSHNYLRGQ